MGFWKRNDDEEQGTFPGLEDEIKEGWAPSPETESDSLQDEPMDSISDFELDSFESESIPHDDEADELDVVERGRIIEEEEEDEEDLPTAEDSTELTPEDFKYSHEIVRRVAHPDREDGRVFVLLNDWSGNIAGVFLVDPEHVADSFSDQEVLLDEKFENVYNGLVDYIDNQVSDLSIVALNGVLLQLARAGIGFLPDEYDPEQHRRLARKLSRLGVQL